ASQTCCRVQTASAPAVSLRACPRGKRMEPPNSQIIIHQPPTEGRYAQGTYMEIQAKEILRMRSQREEMLSRHTDQPLEKIRKDIDRDKFLTASEAKDYGLVDRVLSSRKKTLATTGSS